MARDTIWGVRKAATDILVEISNLCPSEIKLSLLVELFDELAHDPSKWVKMGAYERLGPFICSLKGHEIPEVLIDYYTQLCDMEDQSIIDDNVIYQSAYNLPGVLLTIGKDKWDAISYTYHILSNSEIQSVNFK